VLIGASPVTYDQYNKFCESLVATSYVKQWGDSHVWKVGGKVFAIGGWEKLEKPAFTFKTTQLDFKVLEVQPGFRPAPYMASRGMIWIQLYDPDECDDKELMQYLEESHRIVASGLSKKKQKELGLA